MERGDLLVKRGVTIIDDENDLVPENVGGKIVSIAFYLPNLATSATTAADFAGVSGVTQFVAPKAGSVIGLSVMQWALAAPITVGTATFRPTINGTTVTTMDCVLDATHLTNKSNQNKDVALSTFAAGDLIGVTGIASADLAPNGTADFSILLLIEI